MTAACLMDYVMGGGHLIFGPAVPELDVNMTPVSVLGEYVTKPGTVTVGKGKLTLLPHPAQLDASMINNYRHAVHSSNSALRITMRQSKAHSLLFIANPTDAVQETRLESPWRLQGLWNAAGSYMEGSTDSIQLEPYSIQIWKVAQ